VQSVVQDAPFEPRQGQYDPDSPWPDASQDLEFPLNDPQNPALFLTKDPLTTESAILSLAPGVGSPPLSESSGAAFIPDGRQFSGSSASKSPIVIPVPSCRSREDLQDRGAWTPTVSQVETIGYQANELETVFYYGPQESSLQVSYGPHYILPVPVPEPYYFGAMKPNLSSSQSPSVYASNNYAVSPPTQAVPHFQSRASNTKEKPDKKYFCPRCESGFTLPQMLSRHIKDMHEAKETCSHSSCSFTFSRGRPYIYQKHIEKKHHGLDPEVPPPPEVRQKGSRYAKESSKPYAMGARKPQRVRPLLPSVLFFSMTVHPQAIYVPPATRDPVASPHDVPYCSWATK